MARPRKAYAKAKFGDEAVRQRGGLSILGLFSSRRVQADGSDSVEQFAGAFQYEMTVGTDVVMKDILTIADRVYRVEGTPLVGAMDLSQVAWLEEI